MLPDVFKGDGLPQLIGKAVREYLDTAFRFDGI